MFKHYYGSLIPPLDSLSAAPRRIILHWTGGTYTPNDKYDKPAYPRLVNGAGFVVPGFNNINDNMRPLKRGDTYAAHTLGFNSYSIGVAFCGMADAYPGRKFGPYPLLEGQIWMGLRFVAAMCLTYKLDPMDPYHLFTHYEAQHLHGVPQNNKWDITELEFLSTVGKNEVGNWLRVETYKHMLDWIPDPEVDLVATLPTPLTSSKPEIRELYTPVQSEDLNIYTP